MDRHDQANQMQIFISYSRPDEAAARRLTGVLKEHGFTPWFDKEMLLGGQPWRDEIMKALKSSDLALILFSNASINRDGFYHREIRVCLDILQDKAVGHVWLIPVRLDECKLPSKIEEYQWIDLFPEWNDAINRLLHSLQRLVEIRREITDQITAIEIAAQKPPTQGGGGEIGIDLYPAIIRMLETAGATRVGRIEDVSQLWHIFRPEGPLYFMVPDTVPSKMLANVILRHAGIDPRF